MATQISVRNLTKSYGELLVLDQVSCSFGVGERTGVIGENGSGKSTLLNLLAGTVQPDEGTVLVTVSSSRGGVGHFAQDVPAPPRLTVGDVLHDAQRELREIAARLRDLEQRLATGPGRTDDALAEYGELLTVFELRGGYDADARMHRALAGLGIGDLAANRRDHPLASLSGGEHTRLRLAATLVAAPEVLLLDEPTNHLDDAATTWLEDHLRRRHGTTVLVSHDRVLLERVTTTLVEVDADTHRLTRYGNGYAGYRTEQAAARQRWAQAHERWRADVTRQREALATTARDVAPHRAMADRNKVAYDRHGGRVHRSLSSRVRNAEERLRRLLADPVPPPPEPLRFTPSLPSTELSGIVLDADEVAVTGRLRPTSLTVKAGDRLLVTGPNGAGKTTLLRVLAGELTPDAGLVSRPGSPGRVGHLPQRTRLADPRETVRAVFADDRRELADRMLSLGLFTEALLAKPVGTLSAGQLQRCALARLLLEPADALLLDEPSNHLSLALVEQLETALDDYPGAIIVVSHDRRLRQRWAGGRLDLTAA